MSMGKSILEDVISNNLEELIVIRRSNELGECMEVMEDVISLLSKNNVASRKMCIYCCDEDKGYLDDYYNNIGLIDFSVLERGNRYFGYIVHYVAIVDNYVIDLNANAELNSANDVLFELGEYKSTILSLNKRNAEKMKFVVR